VVAGLRPAGAGISLFATNYRFCSKKALTAPWKISNQIPTHNRTREYKYSIMIPLKYFSVASKRRSFRDHGE